MNFSSPYFSHLKMGLLHLPYEVKLNGGCHIVGKGNGDPLQYSCLENPMDGGPW